MKRIIIYDSDHYGAVQNKCFEKDYAKQGTGHGFTVELATKARSKNYEVVTSDVFLEKTYPNDTVAFCIADMHSAKTNRVLKKGAIPFICLCTESPIIARDFYINIKRLAGRFLYNIQFRGTAERLKKTPTQFSVMYYPVESRVALPYTNWNSKKFLILINRNKRIFFSDYSSVKNIIRSILSPVKLGLQKMIDPWIRSKEIYKDRIEAIYHFSKNDSFYLYGQGWDNRIAGFSARYQEAARKAFRGGLSFEEKLSEMNQFKFALCFENCIFPGYVTEKIFDCFLAGCIPVYYGAPDIKDFVPPETFIDFRKFKDFGALEVYLKNLSESESNKMLEASKSFLASKDFDKYYLENVIEGILDLVESYRVEPKNNEQC